MKNLIFKYLKHYYEINLDTYTKLKIYDKHDQTEVTQDWLRSEIANLYGLEDDELEVFESWLASEVIKVENEVADMQYNIYEKTGIELDLHTTAWVSALHSDALNHVATSREGGAVKVGLSEYTKEVFDKLDLSRSLIKKMEGL